MNKKICKTCPYAAICLVVGPQGLPRSLYGMLRVGMGSLSEYYALRDKVSEQCWIKDIKYWLPLQK